MKYRVLQLISSSGYFGAENVMLQLSTELRAMGHDVTVGVFNNRHRPNTEVADAARGFSLPVAVFDCGGKVDIKTVFKIVGFVKKQSIDIIHSHGYKSSIYAYLANIFTRRRLVVTCHNWIISNSKLKLYTYLDKMFIKRFDAVVSVSSSVRDLLLESGVDERRIHLVANGIDTKKFASGCNGKVAFNGRNKGPGTKFIGTVGRLSQEKGHIYLLRAAKKVLAVFPDCYFVLVGDGVLREALENEAQSLGIREHVIFTGRREDIPEVLTSLDIFTLPSLTEGLPMSLLEAMASGTPVVASKVGDIPVLLKDGALGALVEPTDWQALAAAILQYLKNPCEAEKVSANARKEIMNHYSSAQMAERYIGIYKTI